MRARAQTDTHTQSTVFLTNNKQPVKPFSGTPRTAIWKEGQEVEYKHLVLERPGGCLQMLRTIDSRAWPWSIVSLLVLRTEFLASGVLSHPVLN